MLKGSIEAVTRTELTRYRQWADAFSSQRKDRRYYEIVEDTIEPGFDYRYFLIRDASGKICAIQPFFILNQDLLAGIGRGGIATLIGVVRRLWPRFMRMRTLMMGCAVGEGHLDGSDELVRCRNAWLLAAAITKHAHDARASLIVLKEFPAEYRTAMQCFLQHGYARVPSFPMVRLDLDYADFDDYMRRAISKKMRSNLRRNLGCADRAAPIDMQVVNDATPIIDEIYPLYLQVYERSTHGFEMLTKEYFCRVGRVMPDKVRFFVWRQCDKIIAFSFSMVHDDTVYNEYLGLDYEVALDLHLYFYAFRDIMNWAIANGYKRIISGALNYDPKWHLRFQLYPLDLYVRHRSPILNVAFRWLVPLLEPTRYDRTLPRFANYGDLRGSEPPAEALDVFRPQIGNKGIA